MARACKENGCALIGGETAEMPGFYADGEYDIAGFIVGAVDKSKVIDGRSVRARRRADRAAVRGPAHQRLLAGAARLLRAAGWTAGHVRAASSAPRSARRCWRRTARICNLVRPLLERDWVKGLAHITGGGLTENLPRTLPEGCAAEIDLEVLDRSRRSSSCFSEHGHIARDEMFRAFNMGVGMVIVCSLARRGADPQHADARRRAQRLPARLRRRRRPVGALRVSAARVLGVLISGRGSNLQSIIDAIAARRLDATIAVVVSNRADAPGLQRARDAGIEALHLSPRDYPDRDAYDRALAELLRARGVELVCLAGFMRLVGRPLLDAFPNRILNIHPSLLPAFPGPRRAAPGARARRSRDRRHRAPRRRRPRRRADRAAGGGAGARRTTRSRRSRPACSSEEHRALSRGDRRGARRRLVDRRPAAASGRRRHERLDRGRIRQTYREIADVAVPRRRGDARDAGRGGAVCRRRAGEDPGARIGRRPAGGGAADGVSAGDADRARRLGVDAARPRRRAWRCSAIARGSRHSTSPRSTGGIGCSAST